MLAAVLAAASVWFSFPATARHRFRGLTQPEHRRDVPRSLLVTGLVAVVAFAMFGPSVGVVAVLVSLSLSPRMEEAMRRRAHRRAVEALLVEVPGALDLMAAAVGAGRSPGLALGDVRAASDGPICEVLADVERRLENSADTVSVWSGLGAGPLAGAGRALARSEGSGLPVSQVLTNIAAETRRDVHRQRREAVANLAVVSTVPMGLCFLPAFTLVTVVPLLFGMLGGQLWLL